MKNLILSKVQKCLNWAVEACAETLVLAGMKYIDCECNEDKKIDEENTLKPKKPQLSMDKFFLYFAIAASTLPFVLLGKFMLGKVKGF